MTIKSSKANQFPYFTVFTPTYNRVRLLPRVYNSLCKQTYSNFEWLIIDDGSTDGTPDLVKKWESEGHLSIRYYYQENQGKHIAWNKAADLARGEYFLCADSDDEFVPNSLESFQNCFESIPDLERNQYYGASALCKTPIGNVVGDFYPANISVSNFIELYFHHKIQGEKWNCGRTKIHREIRFEEQFRCSYLPEGTIWFKIAEKYKVLLLNQPLRIYHPETDSICHTFSCFKNAPGLHLLSQMMLNDYLRTYWRSSLPLFFNNATDYIRSCFHLGILIRQQIKDLHTIPAKLLWAIMFPKGFAFYLYDKYRKARPIAKPN